MVVGLNSVGAIPSVLMLRGSNFVRNSMGFAHPNNFGQLLFIAYSASFFELKGRSGKKVNRDPYGFERGLLNEITEYKAITKMPAASIFELKGRSGLAGIFCFAIAFFVADSKTSAAGIFVIGGIKNPVGH